METLIFLIIVGVLSAIFGKGRIKNNQQKGKSILSGGFEEFKTLIQTHKDDTQPLKPPVKIRESIERKYHEIKKTAEKEIEEAVQPVFTPTIQEVEPIKLKIVDEQPSLSEEWNSQTVINGLIWSEILGEPRSRKPYFPRKG